MAREMKRWAIFESAEGTPAKLISMFETMDAAIVECNRLRIRHRNAVATADRPIEDVRYSVKAMQEPKKC